TLGSTGVVVVLPEATLTEAHAEGVSTENAVRAFLERYGQHCSELLDLDKPHPRLEVKLRLQRQAALEDAEDQVQESVLGALKPTKGRPIPRIEGLFVSAPELIEFIIDYVPTRQARCVLPGADLS
ncbi:MAG TPA: hypothetical protein VKT70_02395, partial [Stellaceae bacterium]|nr:hypothetical protein [Stellaceae bacterium]